MKYVLPEICHKRSIGRSPSWGAWIEIGIGLDGINCVIVAPPRGERGLKFSAALYRRRIWSSLPLVGSVD